MLLICGLALCLLRTRMPPPLASLCEGAVSVMLVVLGARAIRRAFAQGSEGTLARRPLLIGMVHGLAGSGALAALALSRMPSLPAQVAYILLFGLGSIAGMGLLSGLAGWPLLHLMRRRRTARVVSAITGSLSLMLGLAWPWT
jgi:tetrahydromethanopterin S-methyltransferase subunit C